MYRLARVIGVSWQEFEQLELWQIRSLAYVTGESVIQDKINQLDVQVATYRVTKSKKPGKNKEAIEAEFKKPIQIDPELTLEEYWKWAAAQNLKGLPEELQ